MSASTLPVQHGRDVPQPALASQPRLTPGLTLLFAVCCGAVVGNLYYAQPLIKLIAPDVGLTPAVAGMIVSITQIGYALGLIFLVPLGDILENRRLMISTLLLAILSLVGLAQAGSGASLLACAALVGFSSVSVQVMVPMAATLADDATRGRAVGTIMSGLIGGILLSRPLASLLADHLGWRAVFWVAAVVVGLVVALMVAVMPARRPAHSQPYGQLLASLVTLTRRHALLRQRSFYQGCMFGALVLFWTAVPLELAQHYGYSQSHIAVFGLIGAAGALVSPLTGRWADAGHGRQAALAAFVLALLSLLPAWLFPQTGVVGLCIAGVVLDAAIQVTMVTGQREIYALDANSRSRLNSVYVTSIFAGGASGAALASVLYEHGGWAWVAAAGTSLIGLALARFLWDGRTVRS